MFQILTLVGIPTVLAAGIIGLTAYARLVGWQSEQWWANCHSVKLHCPCSCESQIFNVLFLQLQCSELISIKN